MMLVLSLLVASCSPDTPAVESSTTTAEPTITTSTVLTGPSVPPINCGPLIDLGEIDIAFDMVGQFPDVITYEGGEACTYVLAENDTFYVRIEPGHPDDFAAGAEIHGVTGEPVASVGEQALWFGTEGGEASTIAVGASTTLGYLHFRIVLGRPDANAATHREATRALALAALPRFPGTEEEPVVYQFDTQPADLSSLGLVENLLTREADGDWTGEEGLVATLRYLAGEIDATAVLRDPDPVDTDSIQVLAMAADHVETGTDEVVVGELTRLLRLLAPSSDDLSQMIEEEPVAAGLLVSAGDLLVQQDDLCVQHFGIPAPCMVAQIPPLLEERWPGSYRVYRPTAAAGGGWSSAWVDNVIEALSASVLSYDELVGMPPINIYLLGDKQKSVSGGTVVPCNITVGPSLRAVGMADARQTVAAMVAYCLLATAYGNITEWWSNGLATHLSGYVYKDTNLEHKRLPAELREIEPTTPLQSRGKANWVFFEYLHEALGGPSEIITAMGSPQTITRMIEDHWHAFNRRLTDTTIVDLGGGDVPFDPPFEDVAVTGPIVMPPEPDAVGQARAQLVVPSGKVACITYEPLGAIQASWRTGVPGTTGGAWSSDLPVELTDVSTFMVSTTDAGKLTITVERVVDEEDGCDQSDQGVIDLDDPGSCSVDCGPSGYYFDEFDD
ncbi:MAG: hypothetical protein L0Z47_10135 [Actinobacteria bacterium]|nr:hypothetical protein [Actinomycetota bacterium]